MKAKLIRIECEFYNLCRVEDLEFIASSDDDMIHNYGVGKLSKQNCDSLFGVVDVEKLAKQFMIDESYGEESTDLWKGYLFGFNKAMELNKDKVFTLEQVKNILTSFYYSGQLLTDFNMDKAIEAHSKQPTEIEVEIEMERSKFIVDKSHRDDVRNGFNYRPKLDSEGCLILKKI